MMSFFEIPKEVLKNLDHFISRFFGKDLHRNINTDVPNGTSYVVLRNKVVWVSLICSYKINAFSPIG
jgi:hypothetical protein